jgi:hypothetical protein
MSPPPIFTAKPAHTTLIFFILSLILPVLAALLLPSFAQPQSFHAFADQRPLWGLPHALNVLTNVPFLVIGLAGVIYCARATALRSYWVLYFGVLLTGVGSSVYHLAPSDATLVWDRLPIALSLAALLAATVSERLAANWHGLALALAVLTGCGSVLYWALSGNLLPYLVMQVSFIVSTLGTAALSKGPAKERPWLFAAGGLYALGVGCERLDQPLAQLLGHGLSGHPIKHLMAAAAVTVILVMVQRR